MMKPTQIIPLIAITLLATWLPASAQSTAFTYQGFLTESGGPANGVYDLQVTLQDAATLGNPVGSPINLEDVGVTNGLFSVSLDFTATPFDGNARWLEIAVRPGASGDAYTNLEPRQPITATPYATRALNVDASGVAGTLGAGALSGGYSNAVDFSNAGNTFAGTFSGSGAGLSNVNASTVGGLGAGAFWQLGGNTGTVPGTHYIGTTDGQPVELRVGSSGGLRISETVSGVVNVVGGSAGNYAGPGIGGVTIFGGNQTGGGLYYRTNAALSPGTTISGGGDHMITINAAYATISGGFTNTIEEFGDRGVIGGGANNAIRGSSTAAVIGGGEANSISGNSDYAAVSGGKGNSTDLAAYSAIAGGRSNVVSSAYGVIGGGYSNQVGGLRAAVVAGAVNVASGQDSFIGGGWGNYATTFEATVAGGIQNGATAQRATVGGGGGNIASGIQSTVGGGVNNRPSGLLATIAGGEANIAQGDYSFIGGGVSNTIDVLSTRSTIGGGRFNAIVNGATRAVIAGGEANTVTTNVGTIGGGTLNTVSGGTATISGGSSNRILVGAIQSFIGGGRTNVIGINTDDGVIAGGEGNQLADGADRGAILGGFRNFVTAPYGTVGGGDQNSAGNYATIGGGQGNLVASNSAYATVAGGISNQIYPDSGDSTVGGGRDNDIAAGSSSATIAGGNGNDIGTDASWSTVGGGYDNNISNNSTYAVIPGGQLNSIGANASYAFAAGRRAKANHQGAFVWADSTDSDFASTASNQFTVRASGGLRLETSGAGLIVDGSPAFIGTDGSSLTSLNASQLTTGNVPSGRISGTYSSAVTFNNAANSFTGSGAGLTSLSAGNMSAGTLSDSRLSANVALRGAANTFSSDQVFNGNIGVGTNSPTERLHVIGNILASGTVTGSSDRNVKENFTAVDPQEALTRVTALPIQRWNYIGESTTHIGPMAQDFHAAFQVGMDDKHISMVDADGVALAAIQGLNAKVESGKQKAETRIQKLEAELNYKDTEITELKQKNSEMEIRLNALEKLMKRLSVVQNGGGE